MSWPWIAAIVATWVLMLLLAIVVLGTLRRIGAVLEQAELSLRGGFEAVIGGALAGTRLPPFALQTRDGEEVRSDELLSSPALFLFVDANCGPCRTLVPQLADAGRAIDGLPLFVVTGSVDGLAVPETIALFFETDRREAAQAFQGPATPQAFVVSDNIVVERSIPNRLHDLHELVNAARRKGVVAPQETEFEFVHGPHEGGS